MSGEHDLQTLVSSMSATLADGVYVFATLPDRNVPAGTNPIMTFQEAEGTTLILSLNEAEAMGLTYEFPCGMITLNAHSALDAVGFIALVASKLAAAGMGVNPIAGFFHDHLFVPTDRADDALAILQAMQKDAQSKPV